MFESGFMGSQHDSFCWQSTPCYKAIRESREELMPRGTMLLADGAYRLSHWMMKPYPHHRGRVPAAEWRRRRAFNKALSGARLIVESAFGALKGRFKCLQVYRWTARTARSMSIACAVLHNLALFQRDDCEANGELTWEEAVGRMRWQRTRRRPQRTPDAALVTGSPEDTRQVYVAYVANMSAESDEDSQGSYSSDDANQMDDSDVETSMDEDED